MWYHGVCNDVQQMWALAVANQRKIVLDKFVCVFLVYLGSFGFQLDVEDVQKLRRGRFERELNGFLQCECARGDGAVSFRIFVFGR